MKILLDKNKQIEDLCTKYNVEKLYAFGSVVNGSFDKNKESDIDFFLTMIYGLPPLEKGESILQLWQALEGLFNRKIDLLTDTSVKNPYLIKEIERTKKIVYDRQHKEASH